MIPAQFDYVAPSSLDEAIALLGAHGGEAKILFGGQSLIPMLKLRLATAGVAVQLALDDRGGCTRAGIGLTNVGPTPIAATRAEAFLQGKPLDDGTIARAAEIAAGEADPVEDRRGSVDYKRDLVRVLAMRALRLAATRRRSLPPRRAAPPTSASSPAARRLRIS
jgi:CO/xanthine dehydrogenase FAD-binding subunit